MRRLIFVAFFLEVGLFLIVLPWSVLWDRNYFVWAWPALRALLSNNFIRGAVTGIGIVNVCAAFVDLAEVFSVRNRRNAHVLDPFDRRGL